MKKLTFRSIGPDDAEFLYSVYASTREWEMDMTSFAEAEKEAFLRHQFDMQHTQWLATYQDASFQIILCDDAPVGRLYVDRKEEEIRIIDIALLTEARRKGIGSRIMADLIDEAAQKNMPLTLHVEMNNPALGLYERLGFEKICEVGAYYFMEKNP